MSALATAVVCLPLLTGGGSAPQAELGGSLVEQRTQQRLSPSTPLNVRAFSEDTCLAEAPADFSGRYVLQLTPGSSWLQVLSGGQEVAANPSTQGGLSMWMTVKQKLSQLIQTMQQKISIKALREHLLAWKNKGPWPGAPSHS